MTNKQIKAELTALGVAFGKSDGKASLMEQLKEAREMTGGSGQPGASAGRSIE